jgi:LmbE family N-acetylglucosaminyl deacetylase
MKRVLVVSAHPDDMEIGMGGTVAKMANSGDEIVSVVITDGRRAPDPTSLGQAMMAELRKDESEKAAAVLGINKTISFGLESLASDDACIEATKKMVEMINSFGPEEIYTLHPELDRHSSHRTAGKISVDALLQYSNENITLWAYEVWGLFPQWDRFENITDEMPTKLAAIGEHKSQIAAIPYIDGISGLNRWRAVFADPHQSEVKAEYAEVFIRLK